MKTIGIIGGLGPQATMDFVARIHNVSQELIARLDESIWAVMEGKVGVELGKQARDAIDYLRTKNTDRIILGCTEVPLLLGNKAEEKDLINPSQLLAEAAVRFAISK